MRRLSMDRRMIYGLLFLVVLVPLLVPLGLPLTVTDQVKQAYDVIKQLPPGSPVLFSVDYPPNTTGELNPVTKTVLNALAEQGAKVVTITSYTVSVSIPEAITAETYGRSGKKYGEDWVNLGFYAGLEPTLVAMCDNIRDVYKTDSSGTPLDSLPLMRNLSSLKDFNLVVSINAAGGTGVNAGIFVRQINVARGVPLLLGAQASQAAGLMPYLNSKNIVGLIGGLKGAAEMEKLTQKPGSALAGMDALSLVAMLILILLVLGNASYLADRRARCKDTGASGGVIS